MKILVLCLLFPLLLAGQTIQMNQGAQTSGTRAAGGATPFVYNVPQNYSTIQQAIDAAAAANSGPVIISPGVPQQNFTNPKNVRIQDYRQSDTFLDSFFSRDVKEWGVKGNGRVVLCNVTAGNPQLYCYDSIYGVGQLTQADPGKLVIVSSVGPPTGRVVNPSDGSNPLRAASGGSGGKDGWQTITFTDTGDGCSTTNGQPDYDTMPYAWVEVVAGVPTGTVKLSQSWRGDKCTRPPTRGTVDTVSGEVTFTGGMIERGEWVTTIASVDTQDTHRVNLAEAPPNGTGGGIEVRFGSDDHDALQAACNAIRSGSNSLTPGHLTFSGMVMISRGVDCASPNFHLEGIGMSPVGRGFSSNIIYAGRTRGDYIIKLLAGWNTKIERMGFRGNTMAQPDAVRISLPWGIDPNAALGIGQMHIFDQVWFGWQSGDVYPLLGYPLRHGIDIDTIGNTDFGLIENSYFQGLEVAFDSNNNQSTNWTFHKVHSQHDNVGFSVIGTMIADDYYTEFNRVDIVLGSPTYDPATYLGAYPINLRMANYGGEGSAMAVEMSPHYWGVGWTIDINANTLGLESPYDINPRKRWIDLSRMQNGTFKWFGVMPVPDATVLLRYPCDTASLNYDLSGIFAENLRFVDATGGSVACANAQSGWLRLHNNFRQNSQTDVSILFNSHPEMLTAGKLNTTLQSDTFFQNTIGSILVKSPRPPGQTDWEVVPFSGPYVATTGTGALTYRYQLTCDDGRGLESNPTPVLALSNGQAPTNGPLNTTTNYNFIRFSGSRGCIRYHLYGDEGSGSIDHLLALEQDSFTGEIVDYGVFSRDANRHPPAATASGIVDAERGFKVNGQYLASTHLADFAATAAQDGQVPVFNGTLGKYQPGNVSGGGPGGGITSINGNSNANQVITGTGIANVVSQAGTTTVSIVPTADGILASTSSGGGTSVVGYNNVGSGQSAIDNMKFTGFIAQAAGTLRSCRVYIAVNPTGKAYCGLYAADGSGGGPGTLLCDDTSGTPLIQTGWNTIGSTNLPTCPVLTSGSKYFIAIVLDDPAVPIAAYEAGAATGQYQDMSAYSSIQCCGFPATVNSSQIALYPNMWSVTAELGAGGSVFTAYNATHLVPSDYLGTGATGSGSKCLLDNQTFGACGTAGGGGVTAGTAGQYQTAVWESPTSIKGIGPGTAGQVFTSNGASADPSWQAAGGPPALSDLTPATKSNTISNGNYSQTWRFGLSSVVGGLILTESPVSTAANSALLRVSTASNSSASPLFAMAGSNGLQIQPQTGNVIIQGTAKLVGPVQLPGIANATSLGTDQDGNIVEKAGSVGPPGGGETPIYNNTFDLSVSGGLTALSGLGCSGNTCTLATPTSNGTYSVKWFLTQITPGSGGTCNAGSVQLRLSYKNSDSGEATAAARILVGRASNSAGFVLAFPVNGAANSQTNEFIYAPFEFRAAGGTPITLQVNITPASNCDTPAVARLRLALFGPLPY